ncbi:MAG: hypothetical protein HGA87_01465 [Desulfobulbaceae bacterium]|nr:hypothetical protein [Desulfobulbaceae bacterium]
MTALLPGIIGGGAAGGFSAVGLLSTGATIFSALSEASGMKMQAKQAELQGLSEEVQATEKSNAMREEFLKNLSSSQALFGAQGTSLSTGDPLNASIESTANIGKETSKVALQGQINKRQMSLQANEYRRSANSAIISGAMKAGKTLLGS